MSCETSGKFLFGLDVMDGDVIGGELMGDFLNVGDGADEEEGNEETAFFGLDEGGEEGGGIVAGDDDEGGGPRKLGGVMGEIGGEICEERCFRFALFGIFRSNWR